MMSLKPVRLVRAHRRLLASLTAALVAPCTCGALGASPTTSLQPPGEDAPEIYQGAEADVCQLPMVVGMVSSLSSCTGTLVHPELVLYAAHCPFVTEVQFGETWASPARSVPVDHCARYTETWLPGEPDYAYCKLAEPVTDVPIVPVAYGCEVEEIGPGTEVIITGFGEDEDGVSGIKRWANATVAEGEGNAAIIGIGGEGTTIWSGDSGGPALLEMADGTYRTFAIASYIYTLAEGQLPGYYANAAYAVGWIEQSAGLDITPCHDVDGTWNPGSTCGAFARDLFATGSWDDGCAGQEVGGYATSCGEGYDVFTDETPPQVAILTPEDGARIDTDPASMTVTVEALDGESDVARVWIHLDGAPVAEDLTAPPFTFAGLSVAAGTVVVEAFAEDLAGNVGGSAPVVVEVGAPEDDEGCACDVRDDTGDAGALALACGGFLALGWRRRRRRFVAG